MSSQTQRPKGFDKRLHSSICAIVVICLLPLGISVARGAPGAFLLVPNNDGQTATNGRVNRYNGLTGAFLDVVIPSLGVDVINGLTVGPDGNLYVSAFDTTQNINGRILRFDGKTGAFINVFVPPGSGGLFSPFELTFGPDGNLYVVNNTPGADSVLRYDGQTGTFIDVFATGLSVPQDLAFGSDGNLYVTNGFTFVSSVTRFNGVTGAFIDTFVSSGSGGLDGPHGLTFGPDGNLYVASAFTDSVFRYDGTTGAFIDQFVAPNSGGLSVPVDLVFGSDGNLYVNSSAGAVLRYDGVTGAFIDAFVSAGSGGLGLPRGGLLFTHQCVQPPPGLVSWWPGDGNANDVQKLNDGTLQGGATFAPGMVGQAVSLNGVDAFVEAPENGSLDFNGPFTIDLWVNPNTDAGPGKRPLVSKYDFGSSNFLDTAYELSLFPPGVLQFGITCGTNPIMFRQTVPNALPLNVFSHVAAVYSQDPIPALEIYVNGVAQDGTTLGGVLCTFINQNNIPFRIGKRIDAGFGPVFFDGLIDEVEVFNRALSDTEIQAIYNAGRAGKCKPPTIVSVDIKPGTDPNTVNLHSRGVIPVAILTTDTFDATTVDLATVTFGPDHAEIVHPSGHVEDVDSDGDFDLLLHFRTQETGIQCADTQALLTGTTFDGTAIEGSDAIVVSGAEARLIDFEGPLPILSDNDPFFTEHPAVISVDGFVLTHTVPANSPPSEAGFRSAKPAAPFYPGSTALFARHNGPIMLMRESGEPFGLTSIDVFELPNLDQNGQPIDPGDFPITFTGNVFGGGMVTQAFVKDDFLTLQTFRFSGFENLASVTWRQGPGEGGPGGLTHQFDNIRACVSR